MTRLEQYYKDSVTKSLQDQFSYGSSMEIPKITKITLNMGIGEASQDKKIIQGATSDLELISGQKPVVTVAKRAIAGFKIREGMPIGAKVTLRGERMYEFLERLVSISIPRIRDFRGLSPKAFDGRGNYALGLQEHLIFPEIDPNKVEKARGFNICIETTAKTDDEAHELLKLLGFPFRRKGEN